MKKEDTQNHILDTAIDLFWAKSYHGVNMNELSRVAGVNKATVYQHFTSKEELAVAAIHRAAERTEEFIYQSTFAETQDPKERLARIYHKVFQMHEGIFSAEGKCRGCPFVNIGVELSTSSGRIRKTVGRALASFERYYGQIVDAHGTLPNGFDRKETVSSLMANMNGALVASKLENRPGAILDGQRRALQFLAM